MRIHKYNTTSNSSSQSGDGIDGERAFNVLGTYVTLSKYGSIVVIGVDGYDCNGKDSGHVYIFEYKNTYCNKLCVNINCQISVDASGYAVALTANVFCVAIGAIYNNGSGSISCDVRI